MCFSFWRLDGTGKSLSNFLFASNWAAFVWISAAPLDFSALFPFLLLSLRPPLGDFDDSDDLNNDWGDDRDLLSRSRSLRLCDSRFFCFQLSEIDVFVTQEVAKVCHVHVPHLVMIHRQTKVWW